MIRYPQLHCLSRPSIPRWFPERVGARTTDCRVRRSCPAPTRPSHTTVRPIGASSSRPKSAVESPRSFPASGFQVIEPERLVEEEEVPDYRADRFFPVQLGQVFEGRYQVVAKLGFGSSSTTWLARDLCDREYVALKFFVQTSKSPRELPAYDRIMDRIGRSAHPGRSNIRLQLASFTCQGPNGEHLVLVLQPAQMSLRDLKTVFFKDGFDEAFVRGAITELLKAVDFLHSECEIVHTDIHPGNMLLGLYNNDELDKLADAEMRNPVPRKLVSSDRTIYLSRATRPKVGPMLLSDFGEARVGDHLHGGDIMPVEYRAPEVLACLAWSCPVDIWSVALCAWDLLNKQRLFTARDDDGDLYDAAHLAQIIAAIGDAPQSFKQRNQKYTIDYWDETGTWTGMASIPEARTMEEMLGESSKKLQDPARFLAFLRRALRWLPEDRPTAKELLEHPWITGQDES